MITGRNIIFHIPLQLDSQRFSASQIRPQKMIEAFQQIGYQVDIISGAAAVRKKQIQVIKQKIRNGIPYDFLYSESSTMPTLLTESHHLPLYPCLDFGFFRFCKKNGIPIGLFYRDIYWCFINNNRDWKQRIARFFYQYDLRKYRQLVDVFFLPSLEMRPYIPFRFDKEVVALPPGGELKAPNFEAITDKLRLLYVGGVGGDYDLTLALQAAAQCPFVQLTICCRASDWQAAKARFAPLLTDNVKVVHHSPAELPQLYAQNHLFLLFIQNSYWEFAVPFKLFEAVGYQIPLLAAEGTWCGNFVTDNAVGVTLPYQVEALVTCLQQLHQTPDLLHNFQEKLQQIAPAHTWESRAQTAANALLNSQK